jgi:uncharacterized protein YdeI (YjbR/CyaY-like superfamily)
MNKIKNFEDFISNKEYWRSTLIPLRKIILSTGLEETIKWGTPVYTYNGKNIVGIGVFKSYAGLWFFQGALLKDEKKKLINAQEGITKVLRQWRFDSVEDVEQESKLIKNYVRESILNQKQGKELKPVKEKKNVSSPELKSFLQSDLKLKESFNSLSKSKQREYSEYINGAKKMGTKQNRLEKIAPMILEKTGLNDKNIKKQ